MITEACDRLSESEMLCLRPVDSYSFLLMNPCFSGSAGLTALPPEGTLPPLASLPPSSSPAFSLGSGKSLGLISPATEYRGGKWVLCAGHLEGWAFRHHMLNVATKGYGKEGVRSSSTTSVTLDNPSTFLALSLVVCRMIVTLPTSSLSGSFTSLTAWLA